MGKATGFLEIKRQQPQDRKPTERVNDWAEFHIPLSEQELKCQGARCMDCGVPFCHAGNNLKGMASGCPIHNLIPEWNDLVYHGLWQEAYERLAKTNNFPEFTGRVCPAPCEGSCVLGISEPPVTIKNIEVSIVDKAFEQGWIIAKPPTHRSGNSVAVVGSGPAGLACADQLNKAGHTVTVFERADQIGGLLFYGIPNMKLDKHIVTRRVNLLAQEGIIFKTNIDIGKDLTLDELSSTYNAVILACGATQARDLNIPGRQLKGIHNAMEFLTQTTQRLVSGNIDEQKTPITGGTIDTKGKRVVVIGGGDTGTDCVATSLRQGCKSIKQLELLNSPPYTRSEDNPWPEWPLVYSLDYGQEEAKALFGQDPRQYHCMTKAFIGNDQGELTGLKVVDVEWTKDTNGKKQLREIPDSETVLEADIVFLALGFVGPEKYITESIETGSIETASIKTEGIERQASNKENAALRYHTAQENIFTCGDMRRGQSLVVWAIKEGREAAAECHRYLNE